MLKKVALAFCLVLIFAVLAGCVDYSEGSASTDLPIADTQSALPSQSMGSTTVPTENTEPAESTEATEPAAHIHNYYGETVAPGCTEEGYILHSCSCGDSFTDSYTDPLGHDWGPWQTVADATEQTEGLQERSCSRCNAQQSQTLPKLEPGHTHAYTDLIVGPTCTSEGYTLHSCSCGDTYTDEAVASLGHSFQSYQSNADATCTADGTKTATCDRCEATSTVTDAGTKLDHNWSDWTVTQEPTVSAEGLQTRCCNRCGASDSQAIEKLPEEHIHDYQKETVAATCTEGGYKRYTCSCGDSYREETSDPKGHTWGPWRVSVEPTVTGEGMKCRICEACGAEETDTVEALPEENSFIFVSWSATVGRNEDAHVTIKGQAGIEYEITVYYKSGPSTAKGLEMQVADENGYVTWTWHVGGRTSLGTFKIVVTGGGESRTIYFTIEE